MDDIATRYFWQIQHYMAVADEQQTYLSVLFGNSKWDYTIIKQNDKALADLIAQETKFWQHVTDDIEPEDRIPEGKVDVNTRAMREVDATGNNMWGTAAAQWLECRTSAKKFKDADADIKKLIEPDVRRMFGHGIEVKRASNGSLRIGEKND
jgi:predicted phage-related endonuclease